VSERRLASTDQNAARIIVAVQLLVHVVRELRDAERILEDLGHTGASRRLEHRVVG
jgi:hypothetical protein